MDAPDLSLIRLSQIGFYSVFAAVSFLIWDIVITFDQEVELIWGRKFTWTTVLYFFLRYVGTSIIVFNAFYRWASSHLAWIFDMATGCLLVVLVEIVLMLRIYALYNRSRIILCVIGISFLGEIVGAATVVVLKTREYIWVPVIVQESVLFGLCLVKLGMTIHDFGSWKRTPLIATLIRDGVWAFALLFAALVLNQRVHATLPEEGYHISYSWMITSFIFCGYRLLLNARSLVSVKLTQPTVSTDLQFQGPAPHQPSTATSDSIELGSVSQ